MRASLAGVRRGVSSVRWGAFGPPLVALVVVVLVVVLVDVGVNRDPRLREAFLHYVAAPVLLLVLGASAQTATNGRSGRPVRG